MELFLNLLWLSMAFAALAAWRAQVARQRQMRQTRRSRQSQAHRAAPWRQWTAFSSAAVLLFFAVSLTDDLHANVILFDESSSGRRQFLCAEGHHVATGQPLQSGNAGPAILPAAPLPMFMPVSALDSHAIPFSYASTRKASNPGRAPPAVFT